MSGATGLLRPEYARLRVDFENGSRVTLDTSSYGEIRGTVRFNPKEGREKRTHVFLQDAVVVVNGVDRRILGCLRIGQEEIKMVLHVDHPQKPVRKCEGVEKLLKTVLIKSTPELNKVTSSLANVKEVGLNFYGKFSGRKEDVPRCITICITDTLFVVDTMVIPKWASILCSFFEDEKICKILYHSGSVATHLYHGYGIYLNNICDLQTMDYLVRLGESSQVPQAMEQSYLSLPDLLHFRLASKITKAELEFLKGFEKQDVSNLLSDKPLESNRHYCKLIALEMKYLVDLKTELFLQYHKRIQYIMEAQLREVLNERPVVPHRELVRSNGTN